jgi:hypothetical protein
MDQSPPDFECGDASGVAFPTHPQALLAAGPAFLTAALHASGSLPADAHVRAITAAADCPAGNSGKKLFLTLDYEGAPDATPRELFAKFSRQFDDPFRDRRRFELEAEVRLADLSRDPAFPVRVAKAMFADFHHGSGSGVLITERIAFGQGNIEPLRVKCMDHELPDPERHYRATVRALARLAGAQKAGKLSPRLEALFPWDRASAVADPPRTWPADAATGKARAIAAFIASAPQLFPPAVAVPAFAARLVEDARAFVAHETQVRRFLQSDPDLVALGHWNTNLDNAWFETRADGELEAGLLDWGMVRQMNAGYALWGGLSASDPAMLAAELDGLLSLYACELAANGGPVLDPGRLALHFDLSVMLLGIAMMFDCPTLVAARVPGYADATGPRDPLLASDQVAHGFLHVFTNCLMLWERCDFGASLRKI